MLIKPTSSKGLPPIKFTTASSIVPALSMPRIRSLAVNELIVPSVAVEGTMIEIAAGTLRVFTVPLAKFDERKSRKGLYD